VIVSIAGCSGRATELVGSIGVAPSSDEGSDEAGSNGDSATTGPAEEQPLPSERLPRLAAAPLPEKAPAHRARESAPSSVALAQPAAAVRRTEQTAPDRGRRDAAERSARPAEEKRAAPVVEPAAADRAEFEAMLAGVVRSYGAGRGFTGVGAGDRFTGPGFTGMGHGNGFNDFRADPGFTGMSTGNGFTGTGAGPGFTGIGASAPSAR